MNTNEDNNILTPTIQPATTTRRGFIKRTASATMLAAFALGAFENEAQATGAGGSGYYVLEMTGEPGTMNGNGFVPVETDSDGTWEVVTPDGSNVGGTGSTAPLNLPGSPYHGLTPRIHAKVSISGYAQWVTVYGQTYLEGSGVGLTATFTVAWLDANGVVQKTQNLQGSMAGDISAWLTDNEGFVDGDVTPGPNALPFVNPEIEKKLETTIGSNSLLVPYIHATVEGDESPDAMSYSGTVTFHAELILPDQDGEDEGTEQTIDCLDVEITASWASKWIDTP